MIRSIEGSMSKCAGVGQKAFVAFKIQFVVEELGTCHGEVCPGEVAAVGEETVPTRTLKHRRSDVVDVSDGKALQAVTLTCAALCMSVPERVRGSGHRSVSRGKKA